MDILTTQLTNLSKSLVEKLSEVEIFFASDWRGIIQKAGEEALVTDSTQPIDDLFQKLSLLEEVYKSEGTAVNKENEPDNDQRATVGRGRRKVKESNAAFKVKTERVCVVQEAEEDEEAAVPAKDEEMALDIIHMPPPKALAPKRVRDNKLSSIKTAPLEESKRSARTRPGKAKTEETTSSVEIIHEEIEIISVDSEDSSTSASATRESSKRIRSPTPPPADKKKSSRPKRTKRKLSPVSIKEEPLVVRQPSVVIRPLSAELMKRASNRNPAPEKIVVQNDIAQAIMTDDESIEEVPMEKTYTVRKLKKKAEETSSKQKVDTVEKLAAPTRKPRTKKAKPVETIAEEKTEPPQLTMEANYSTPSAVNRYLPSLKQPPNHNALSESAKKTLSFFNLVKIKEVEAQAKKEAMLLKQSEEKRRRREERELHAKKQREENEKQKQRIALQQATEKASRAREKEEEAKLKLEAVRKQMKQKQLQLQAAASVEENVEPIYMRQEMPLLPTPDCYDSDDERRRCKIVLPEWCTTYKKHVYSRMVGFINSRVRNTLFSVKAQTPNLREIFPNVAQRRLRRNSSAIWSTVPRFTMMNSLSEDF